MAVVQVSVKVLLFLLGSLIPTILHIDTMQTQQLTVLLISTHFTCSLYGVEAKLCVFGHPSKGSSSKTTERIYVKFGVGSLCHIQVDKINFNQYINQLTRIIKNILKHL
jgi:hypothetical protein